VRRLTLLQRDVLREATFSLGSFALVARFFGIGPASLNRALWSHCRVHARTARRIYVRLGRLAALARVTIDGETVVASDPRLSGEPS
jgi:hypothetical protein